MLRWIAPKDVAEQNNPVSDVACSHAVLSPGPGQQLVQPVCAGI